MTYSERNNQRKRWRPQLQQCAEWDQNQCRATKDLTACVMAVKQGSILKGPDKVVVLLCPKHFQLKLKN